MGGHTSQSDTLSFKLGVLWLISFGFLAVMIVVFLKSVDDRLVTSQYESEKKKILQELRLAQFTVSRGVCEERSCR